MDTFNVNTEVTFIDEQHLLDRDVLNMEVTPNSVKDYELLLRSKILIFRPSNKLCLDYPEYEKISKGIVLKSRY